MKPWELLPSLVSFALLILTTIAIDAILHFFNAAWIDRYLGIPGVGLILLSFVYSLRKRRYIRFGSLKSFLGFHEAATWLGALLIGVHAGIHFNAFLPWLAVLAMLISIASGFTGRHLLGRAKSSLEQKKEALQSQGLSEEQIDDKLMLDAAGIEIMQKWRSLHHPITILFAGLGAFHVFSIFMFGGRL